MNVVDVPYDAEAVVAGVQRCLQDSDWRLSCQTCENPYGRGDSGFLVAEALGATTINSHLLQKR